MPTRCPAIYLRWIFCGYQSMNLLEQSHFPIIPCLDSIYACLHFGNEVPVGIIRCFSNLSICKDFPDFGQDEHSFAGSIFDHEEACTIHWQWGTVVCTMGKGVTDLKTHIYMSSPTSGEVVASRLLKYCFPEVPIQTLHTTICPWLFVNARRHVDKYPQESV